MRPGILVATVALVITPSLATAQGLREQVFELFKFGNCAEPLCLPSLQQQGNEHGNHYIPAAVTSGELVLRFLTSAVATALSNLPISSTSSGATFAFVGGAPVKTTLSAGPVFGERAQTLGRGRTLIGVNVSAIKFRNVRGIPLNSLIFNITHENAESPNELGNPTFENDLLTVHAAIDLDSYVSTVVLTRGLTDRLDVGLAVPLVSTSLRGRSVGEITPFGSVAVHYFGGTAQDPQLSAVATTSGSAFGVGDVAARLKLNLVPSGSNGGGALLTEVRLPTGSEEDLLGTGDFSARMLGVVSGRFGGFSPHVNVGGVWRQSDVQRHSALFTVGFDQLVTSNGTFALDLISEWQMGGNLLALPEPVTYTQPFRRTIEPTNVPDIKDNLFNLSAGAKYSTPAGLNVVLNVLVPLNRGGLRPWSVLTGGLEYTF
jgi:hypothetical protein